MIIKRDKEMHEYWKRMQKQVWEGLFTSKASEPFDLLQIIQGLKEVIDEAQSFLLVAEDYLDRG